MLSASAEGASGLYECLVALVRVIFCVIPACAEMTTWRALGALIVWQSEYKDTGLRQRRQRLFLQPSTGLMS
ncbi:MAG: hypothetical protein A2Y91_00310 [Chloroflexi bacterium RBG_13_54_8]|nr:MAG: hypothetical protein A2Y91_00310 [Chloroflexi bacterium RBG_13_54_8]